MRHVVPRGSQSVRWRLLLTYHRPVQYAMSLSCPKAPIQSNSKETAYI